METDEFDQNGGFVEDMSAEQLLSADYSDACGVFGDPDVFPRVGDQYQIDIPPLIPKPDCVCYVKSSTDADDEVCVPCKFRMGLPLQLMWMRKETEKMKDENELPSDSTDAFNNIATSNFESVRNTDNFLRNEDLSSKVEAFDAVLDHGVQTMVSAFEDKMPQCRGPDYYLVPGCCSVQWTDIEKSSFLLGLYIFEKNFVQVKRFIGSKKIGDILSFYYGKFYRSNEYGRWSACRKMRSKKYVYGQRIFSGLRQQELLSRLLPHVLEESQEALLEVSKTFVEGKMSLEEYVLSLKSIVGMSILVEAVGIGKGKQDLTGMSMESAKPNLSTHVRQEIPIGKACSSLTPAEIVKFLTGDYRLSKARSNDIFWEAVWPRLLARGWHSEQPKNQGYATGSKHCLVYLMPGVKKFSRRLVKGNHYLDSVTDVLHKVASEPGLLELDTEEDEGNKKEENSWTNEIKEQEDLPERRRHCYLQPRTPSRNTDVMKFTVVDTSLADRKMYKVRELRSLPEEISKFASLCEDNDQDTSDTSTDEVDQEETNNTVHAETLSDQGNICGRRNLDISSLEQNMQINGSDSPKPMKKSKNHNIVFEDEETRKAVKTNLSRKLKQNNLDFMAPVTKRHRTLTACSKEEKSANTNSSLVVPRSGEEVHGCCSDTCDLKEKAIAQVGSSQDRLPSTSSSKGSPPESTDDSQCDDYHGPEYPQDNSSPWALFDLNLPQVPVDFENGALMSELANRQDGQSSKQPDNTLKAPNTYADMNTSDQQHNFSSRRQGTRNRPPTARVLEALANGFLTTNRRPKNKDASTHENSGPSRRHRRVGMN